MNQDSILYAALSIPIFEPNVLGGPSDENEQANVSNTINCEQFIMPPNIDEDPIVEPAMEPNLEQVDLVVPSYEMETLQAKEEKKQDNSEDQSEEEFPLKRSEKKKSPYRTGDKRHYCDEPGCGYSSGDPARLTRHLRVHRGLRPFACLMCDYSTVNSQMIKEHMFKHTGEKPYKCSHCDHRSASKKNLKMHERRHNPDNPNRCPCGFIGRGRASVRHARICTTINQTLTLKTYKCKVCDYKTTDDMAFVKHKKIHRLKCDKCGYTTLEIAKMRAHNLNCLTSEQQPVAKKFRCKICAWSSKVQQKILLHLIHHPKQEVDESVVDITVLRTCGIMD